MKNKNLPIAIFIFGLFTVTSVLPKVKKIFAVTGEQFGSTNWIAFRQG